MPPGVSGDTHAHTARTRHTWSSLVLGGLVLAAVVSTRWVRLNLSPSVPRGVYRLASISPPLARGTLVVLPVPAAVRPWHSRWAPLLKPVAAVAGDEVCTWEAGLWVQGQWYGPVYQEAGGAPLPRLRGCLRLEPGEVFLASQAPRSLDGRYFCPTPVAALTAQALPLLTW
jgi:type IV secretory pathway protease TraF